MPLTDLEVLSERLAALEEKLTKLECAVFDPSGMPYMKGLKEFFKTKQKEAMDAGYTSGEPGEGGC